MQSRIRTIKKKRAYQQMKKHFRYRVNVIREIISTEAKYVADLEMVLSNVNNFVIGGCQPT